MVNKHIMESAKDVEADYIKHHDGYGLSFISSRSDVYIYTI